MSEHHHDHPHDHGVSSPEEAVALLGYMAHHNAHHAEELEELIDALPEAAREDVTCAASLMRQAGGLLAQALQKIGE